MSLDTTAVVIGAGQAGLAFSRCLSDHGVDHVVLEQGRVANSWRTERWDSLRLLTPSWQSRLPGFRYQGSDPHGYMSMGEVTDYLEEYAGSFDAPVHDQTSVLSVRRSPIGSDAYLVQTDQAMWRTRSVVVATGAFSSPAIPPFANAVPGCIEQLSPNRYRNPDSIPDGGVLVVGASASGVQLADELARAGRAVTIAVGRHARMPRTYRGRDVQWWLDATGLLNARYDERIGATSARRAPSLQLIGTPEKRTIDLGTLARQGVRVAGHLCHLDISGSALFARDLPRSIAEADAAMHRRLDRFDHHATLTESDELLGPAWRPEPIELPTPPVQIDLVKEGIGTVVWATGFRPRYPWLHLPVLDRRGGILHDGGVVTGAPGVYVMGLPFMRRRKSSFIDGVGDDARDLSSHLVSRLATATLAA